MASALAAPFDVILVDLHLPDVCGIEVVQQLTARGITAPIIVVTAFPELESSFAAGCVGAAGYVEGPLFGEDVADVVHQALTGHLPVRHPGRRLEGSAPREPEVASSCDRRRYVTADPRVRQVMLTMEADPTASIEELARTVGLSESRLRHLFSESVGIPISRFLTNRRLQLAAQLLRKTYERIGQIAHRIGVADFNRAFRVRFGMSPHAYRERFRPLVAHNTISQPHSPLNSKKHVLSPVSPSDRIGLP